MQAGWTPRGGVEVPATPGDMSMLDYCTGTIRTDISGGCFNILRLDL
jgi:hypothetical protein